MPTTLSAAWLRNASAPAATWLRTGLPQMPENTACDTPSRSPRNASKTGRAATPRSVTTSGRVQPAEARWPATSLRAPAPNRIGVGNAKRCKLKLGPPALAARRRSSNDLEIPLALPIGDGILPLPPFPFARRREVVDEIVAEPVACALGLAEDARGLDQRARCARNVFGTDVGTLDGLRRQCAIPFDAVEAGRDARGHREIGIDVRPRAARLEPRRLR